jgi:hypothetical protein
MKYFTISLTYELDRKEKNMSQQHKKWIELVQQRLDEKGWSRSDLATVVGVSPAMITQLMKTGHGSDELKLTIKKKLNISESWVNFEER